MFSVELGVVPSVAGLAPKAEEPCPNAPPPPPNAPDEPKVEGAVPLNAPKPDAGFTGPAPNALNVELVVAPPPYADAVEGCCALAPKEPNIEFVPLLDFDSVPPPPRERPPKPDWVSAPASSEDEVISTEIVGSLIGGAVDGDWLGGCWGCCEPNPPKDEPLPNAEGAPENALNPKAPPVVVVGEVEANALGVAGAGEVAKAFCCGA